MKRSNSLFANEEAIIEISKSLLENLKTEKKVDKSDYITLYKNYKKIFKQLKLLVRMGDIQQNKLNKLNEKLDLQNMFIKKTFGKYLSDDIVKCILDSPEGNALGGDKRVITVLLTDLRGFTAITERESAEKIVGMLNIYLEKMTEIIFKYGGTIDEIIGDSLLVIFGAPVKTDNHAEKAVSCAIEMQNAMDTVNKKNKSFGFPEIEMGVGINTAELIVGNIGSEKRTKYAVVGSGINIASRIESYTIGGQIFISEMTKDECERELVFDSDFEVKPKGIEKPIKIYSVSGIRGGEELYLKKRDLKFIELKQPIAVFFTILKDKHNTDKLINAEIIKLNERNIRIRTRESIEKFVNIRIVIADTIINTRKNESIYAYGKITDKSENEYNVYLSSIPNEFKDVMKKYGK